MTKPPTTEEGDLDPLELILMNFLSGLVQLMRDVGLSHEREC